VEPSDKFGPGRWRHGDEIDEAKDCCERPAAFALLSISASIA
jgi:hypothetical protein